MGATAHSVARFVRCALSTRAARLLEGFISPSLALSPKLRLILPSASRAR
jgi:hypothetical protein